MKAPQNSQWTGEGDNWVTSALSSPRRLCCLLGHFGAASPAAPCYPVLLVPSWEESPAWWQTWAQVLPPMHKWGTQPGTAALPLRHQRVSSSTNSLGLLGFHSSAGQAGTGGGIIRGKLSVHSPLAGVHVKDAPQKKKKPQVQGSQTQGVWKLQTSMKTYTPQTQLTWESENKQPA